MTIGDRLNQLKVSRRVMAEALSVGERAVYKWLAYDVELRLSVAQFVALCDLLQWNGADLAEAYERGRKAKKIARSAKGAPGQTSLFT